MWTKACSLRQNPPMLIHRFFLVFTALIASNAVLAAIPESSWQEMENRDGIRTFRQEIPDSPIVAFKGMGIVKAPIAKVTSVLIDSKRTSEWVDAVKETRIVRTISPTEVIAYTHVKTPIIMKDRDFVTRVRLEVDREEKTVTLTYAPAEDPDAPETVGVRGEMMDSSFKLISRADGTETEVIAMVHADPKGSVPKWVVNLFQKVWPRKTIEDMRKQVAKPDITPNPQIDF